MPGLMIFCVAFFAAAVTVYAAWEAPTQAPPLGNAPGFIYNQTAQQAGGNLNISGSGTFGSLCFAGDCISGWNSVGFWAASGNDIYNTNSGRVGLGINSPGGKMQINPAPAEEGLVIKLPATTPFSAINVEDSGNSSLFRVMENGNVGIGMAALPSSRLDVIQSGTTAGIRVSGGTNPHLRAEGSKAQIKLQACDSCDGGAGIGLVGTENNYPLAFYANNSERVRITADGNVGIGIDPGTSYKFYVSGSARVNSLNINGAWNLPAAAGTAAQYLRGDGTWQTPAISENDPFVDAVTNGLWCIGNSSAHVTCNQAAPQVRVSGTCAAGSSIRVINSNGTVSCETDDNTTYSAGNGLSLSGTTFSINTAQTQARVTGTCAAGSSIRVINSDGTVACETDDNTDTNTTYSAGNGLTLTGTTFSINTSQTQARVTGTCAAGSSIRAIAANGAVTCETDTDTDTDTNTTYSAGSGLSLSGTTFSVNLHQNTCAWYDIPDATILDQAGQVICPTGRYMAGWKKPWTGLWKIYCCLP